MSDQSRDALANATSAIAELLRGFDDLPDSAYARLPAVAALFATSQPNVWRWVRKGLIPRPHKLGPQTTAWNVGELRSALAALRKEPLR